MAFSADELRVLRRALAENLHPAMESGAVRYPLSLPLPARRDSEERAEDIHEMLRLVEAIDEAVREGGRLRAFLLAELVRYRSALPGSAAGYLERLEEAVNDGYVPDSEDLAALRRLAAQRCGPEERARRLALKRRCHEVAESDLRERLAARGLATGSRVPAALSARPYGGPAPRAGRPDPGAASALPAAPPREDARDAAARHSAEQPAAPRHSTPQTDRPAVPQAAPAVAAAVASAAPPTGPARPPAVPLPVPSRSAASLPGPSLPEDGGEGTESAAVAAGSGAARLRGLELLIGGAAAAPSGGVIPMTARDPEKKRPAEEPAGTGEKRTARPAGAGQSGDAHRRRAVPTPGDLFPHGVRPGHGEDQPSPELPTGTG